MTRTSSLEVSIKTLIDYTLNISTIIPTVLCIYITAPPVNNFIYFYYCTMYVVDISKKMVVVTERGRVSQVWWSAASKTGEVSREPTIVWDAGLCHPWRSPGRWTMDAWCHDGHHAAWTSHYSISLVGSSNCVSNGKIILINNSCDIAVCTVGRSILAVLLSSTVTLSLYLNPG